MLFPENLKKRVKCWPGGEHPAGQNGLVGDHSEGQTPSNVVFSTLTWMQHNYRGCDLKLNDCWHRKLRRDSAALFFVKAKKLYFVQNCHQWHSTRPALLIKSFASFNSNIKLTPALQWRNQPVASPFRPWVLPLFQNFHHGLPDVFMEDYQGFPDFLECQRWENEPH